MIVSMSGRERRGASESDPTRLYQVAYESSFDGLWLTDGNGVTIAINGSCERNYGVRAAEVVGRHVTELEDAGIFRPSAALLALRQRRRVTVTQVCRSGRLTLVTGNPVFGADGEIEAVVCNSRDITDMVMLRAQLENAEEKVRLCHAELSELRRERMRVDGLVAESPSMQRVLSLLQRLSESNATVLIQGETGVGKNVIAKKIHQLGSRHDGPYLEINCGAIPESLIESELFGYEVGAFTGARSDGKLGIFELASGGTLLLDEISELSYPLQVKLLRVIQEHKVTRLGSARERNVDVRILAATNQDLKAMVEQGRFRMDLFYRLNVLPIQVPPLRERREDIYPLAFHFLETFNRRYGTNTSLTADAVDALLRHAWPGNVRELSNLIERVVLLSEIPAVDASALFLEGRDCPPVPVLAVGRRPLKEMVMDYEQAVVQRAVQEYGSARKAARVLGVSQATVLRRLQPGRPRQI